MSLPNDEVTHVDAEALHAFFNEEAKKKTDLVRLETTCLQFLSSINALSPEVRDLLYIEVWYAGNALTPTFNIHLYFKEDAFLGMNPWEREILFIRFEHSEEGSSYQLDSDQGSGLMRSALSQLPEDLFDRGLGNVLKSFIDSLNEMPFYHEGEGSSNTMEGYTYISNWFTLDIDYHPSNLARCLVMADNRETFHYDGEQPEHVKVEVVEEEDVYEDTVMMFTMLWTTWGIPLRFFPITIDHTTFQIPFGVRRCKVVAEPSEFSRFFIKEPGNLVVSGLEDLILENKETGEQTWIKIKKEGDAFQRFPGSTPLDFSH